MIIERDWRAESDAETLAQAEEIKSDKIRFAKAQTAAAKMVAERKERVDMLSKVAGGKTHTRNNNPATICKL